MKKFRDLASTLPLLLLLMLLACEEATSFTAHSKVRGVSRTTSTTITATTDSTTYRHTQLSAKKKRRRREMDPGAPSPSSTDDLPDFDLDDNPEPTRKSKKKTSSADSSSDPLGEISRNMMGSASITTRSVDQLIADRSLEKTFEFDEPGDDTLPDLAVLAKEQETGRKRTLRDARVAAALERKSEEEKEGGNPLANIPFFVDEKGEVSAIKVGKIIFTCCFIGY